MKKYKKTIILSGIVIIATLGIVYLTASGKNEETESLNSIGNTVDVITLPSELTFAGEKVPIEHFDVRECLDRELYVNAYWHSQTILFMKRCNRFFPLIEPILKKHKVPDDFKYIAVIESGLLNVISPQGARGIWQFIEASAKEYGMEVNTWVDERNDIEKSTEAACKYFKKAYDKFGNWTMAAASFNLGMSGLAKHADFQKTNNYYDLMLNSETTRYIFRILAVKLILSNPSKFGFKIPVSELYPLIKTKVIPVDSTISNLNSFAVSQGINYKMLKFFNPWLIDESLHNPDKKIYYIKIPEAGFRDSLFGKE